MKIILIATPESRTEFLDSMRRSLHCSYETASEVRFPLPNEKEHISMKTMRPEALNGDETRQALKQADALIYAGVQAGQINTFEIQYLKGLSADIILKNLHEVMKGHRENASHAMRA